MSRRITHVLGGYIFGLPITGLVYYFFASNFSYWMLSLVLLVSSFTVLIGAIFPDAIERPTNPDHRKILHSWFMLIIIFSACFIVTFVVIPRYDTQFYLYLILSFLLGYLSHLLLDSTTKQSLR